MAVPTKYSFGQPEKRSIVKLLSLWALVIAILSAIAWMIATNPRQKGLNCNTDTMPALNYFGTCVEE